MFDDDKGRGSYKCGRCGVPKKGHVCPYQPKVKRRPEDPAPEMKCVSTQVEMDEFMTLRRLNLEIQGFPESYAAEPMDMVGAEVNPHPSQVVLGGVSSAPSYSAPTSHPAARGTVEQGHPSGVPSLASMNSHPHPSAYSQPQAAPYSNQSAVPPPNSTPEAKTKNEPAATKSEELASPEVESKPAAEPSKSADESKGVEITTQTDTKAIAAAEESATDIKSEENPSAPSEEKDEAKPQEETKESTTETNNEAGSESNKRIKVE